MKALRKLRFLNPFKSTYAGLPLESTNPFYQRRGKFKAACYLQIIILSGIALSHDLSAQNIGLVNIESGYSGISFGDVAVDAFENIYVADLTNDRIIKIVTDGTATVIAGTGTAGFSGDGGPAVNAKLNYPVALYVDRSSNIYFCDRNNYRIRKIDANGIITTIAGTGINGFSGDGNLATDAQISKVAGIVKDTSGDIFFTDYDNFRIRKINPDGIIYTIAGNGNSGGGPGDGGKATDAVVVPWGIIIDTDGNIVFSDNSAVRKIDALGYISTLSHNYRFVNDITADSNGNIYSISMLYPDVIKMNTNGVTRRLIWNKDFNFLDDVPINEGSIVSPGQGICASPSGNIYFTCGYKLMVISWNTIKTVAGNGTAGFSGEVDAVVNSQVNQPEGMVFDASGSLYFADAANHRVRKITPDGMISTVAGTGGEGFSGDEGPATHAQLSFPKDVAVDSSGNIYISDYGNNRIRKVSADGTIATYAGGGSEFGDNRPATATTLNSPYGIFMDKSGSLLIADQMNNRIRKVTADGQITTVAGNGSYGYNGDNILATNASLKRPVDVAADDEGNIYISDGSFRIRKIDTNGIIGTYAGNGIPGYSGDGAAAIDAQLAHPLSLDFDPYGNLYFSDLNNTVRKISATGYITTIAGSGTTGYNGDHKIARKALLHNPTGIAADPSGNVYISDHLNHRIRKVNMALPDNANLSALGLSDGLLSPGLDANHTEYASTVANHVSNITLTPVAASSKATVKVNNAVVSPGLSLSLPLNIGTNDIAIEVTSEDSSATRYYSLTVVRSENTAPVILPHRYLAINELAQLSFTASATDMEKEQKISYSLVGAPEGSTIHSETGAFSWMPTETQGPVTYNFTVKATDNGEPALSAEQTVVVIVKEVNQPPVVAPIAEKIADELNEISFTASASDPDLPANAISYSLSEASSGIFPEGATIDNSTGVFSWTPSETQGLGTFTAKIVVSDGLAADEQEFQIMVNETNTPPVIAPIGNRKTTNVDSLSFTIAANDTDIPAQPLSYVASSLPPGAVFDPETSEFSWKPGSDQTGDFNITFSISDGIATAEQTVVIKVADVLPSIFAIDPPVGEAGDIITISGLNLENVISISFNGVVASEVISVSANEIVVKVPQGITTGNINIEVTTTTGSTESQDTFKAASITSIDDDQQQPVDNLLIYPNPFSNETQASFYLNKALSPYTVSLIDSEGRLKQRREGISHTAATVEVAIDGNTLKPGVYLILLQTQEGIQTERVLCVK